MLQEGAALLSLYAGDNWRFLCLWWEEFPATCSTPSKQHANKTDIWFLCFSQSPFAVVGFNHSDSQRSQSQCDSLKLSFTSLSAKLDFYVGKPLLQSLMITAWIQPTQEVKCVMVYKRCMGGKYQKRPCDWKLASSNQACHINLVGGNEEGDISSFLTKQIRITQTPCTCVWM